MDIETFRAYCLAKNGVSEEFPFDQSTLVFKVFGKMFALTDIDEFSSVNLKCDPERAVQLREDYDYIHPGYHMNKVHWNTIDIVWDADDNLLISLIDHSYDLVVAKLTKKERLQLESKN